MTEPHTPLNKKVRDVMFDALIEGHTRAVGRGNIIQAHESMRDLILFLYSTIDDVAPAQEAATHPWTIEDGVITINGDLKVTGDIVAGARDEATVGGDRKVISVDVGSLSPEEAAAKIEQVKEEMSKPKPKSKKGS